MKYAAPRRLQRKALTLLPLRGWPVVQMATSTGQLKSVPGRPVRQESLGRAGILMGKTVRLKRTRVAVVHRDGELVY